MFYSFTDGETEAQRVSSDTRSRGSRNRPPKTFSLLWVGGGLTKAPVRNADSQVPPRPTGSETQGVGPRNRMRTPVREPLLQLCGFSGPMPRTPPPTKGNPWKEPAPVGSGTCSWEHPQCLCTSAASVQVVRWQLCLKNQTSPK